MIFKFIRLINCISNKKITFRLITVIRIWKNITNKNIHHNYQKNTFEDIKWEFWCQENMNLFNFHQFFFIFLVSIMKEMNTRIFYRNPLKKESPFVRASRASKLSMDDLTPIMSRVPSNLKARNSNDHY